MPIAFRHVAAILVLAILASTGMASAQVPGLSSLTKTETTSDAGASDADKASLDDLIKILDNETTRQKLVDSLKAAAYAAPADATEAAATEAEDPGLVLSVPGQLARWSQAIIGSAFGLAGHVVESTEDAETLLSGASALDLPRLGDAILPVLIVAIAVFAVRFLSGIAKRRLVDRLARGERYTGPLRKLVLLALAGLASVLAILVAWAAGYVAAIVFFGGPPNLVQALFLNAFLLIELIRGALNLIAMPHHPTLRLTPFGDSHASYWSRWLSRLIAFIGYAFLFVAPVVQQSSSLAAANAVRFMAAFAALATIIVLILSNRTRVRDRLGRARAGGDTSMRARSYALLGHVWWILAIGFVLALFSVWLSSPQDGLRFMTLATLKSLGAMALGGLVVMILSRIILSGIPVPDSVKDRLPLLERRVNSFIPNALTIIRILVVAAVLAVILEAWSLFDLRAWTETDFGQRVLSGTIGAGFVIMLGFGLFLGVSSWIEYRLNPNYGTVPSPRERTLLSLLRNAFTITLLVIIVMLVLSQIGINIGPLLAGAGVVGLAVGFGAQKLVQDIITGAFIQLENAMNVGDVVLVAGVSGTVEKLTIRSVGLRSVDGTYHLIPFSSVDQVANMTKDYSQCIADIGVAYREDVGEVKALMQDAYDILKEGEQGVNLIAPFEMFGVNELGASSIVVRGRIKTLAGKQWAVGRAYNEIVKQLCDERGVELPFPNTTIWFGEDKRGKAPPLHLEAAKPGGEAPSPRERLVAARRDTTGGGAVNADGTRIPPAVHDVDAHDEDDDR